MKALIIDDSRAARYAVRRMLRQLGFTEVYAAPDAATAQEILDTEASFDLVLCDHYMPEINGLDFVRSVRAQRGHADLPVIMISAEHTAEHIDRALHAGANEYLVKPFTVDDLSSKLDLLPASSPIGQRWVVDRVNAAVSSVDSAGCS
ncbi:MAG: response regulator [Actinomycetota bacterium]